MINAGGFLRLIGWMKNGALCMMLPSRSVRRFPGAWSSGAGYTILADEPTGALDSETSVQIMEILRKIAEKKLIIMVTHNPELADQYSTRIIRMLDGRITDIEETTIAISDELDEIEEDLDAIEDFIMDEEEYDEDEEDW